MALEDDRDAATAYQHLGVPGLLRLARRAYGNAVRAAFAEAGFDDVPRNGAYLLARVYDNKYAVADLTRGLGHSKQAVSQLVDTMVMRGTSTAGQTLTTGGACS